MKCSFQLIIRDETENKNILEIGGQSIARTKQGCLRSVRHTINATIKKQLDHIEEKNNQG